jgi:hypothetical protein
MYSSKSILLRQQIEMRSQPHALSAFILAESPVQTLDVTPCGYHGLDTVAKYFFLVNTRAPIYRASRL